MRTRRGQCYPKKSNNNNNNNNNEMMMMRRRLLLLKRRRMKLLLVDEEEEERGLLVGGCSNWGGGKRMKLTSSSMSSSSSSCSGGGGCDLFEALPDDLVLSILCKLSSSADSPSDFINILITCKRLKGLGMNSLVLSKASQKMLAVKAQNWSHSCHRFLKLCADSGNPEACFILGMIRFYCLHNDDELLRRSGASLIAKAAISSHPSALYSLALIQFNGSGGSKNDKDLRAGVALCARAAFLGHVDALRELGHCLQDGYGVKRNVSEGRRFLVQANARELAAVLLSTSSTTTTTNTNTNTSSSSVDNVNVVPKSWWNPHNSSSSCPSLLSDFGCNVPAPVAHPANQFLCDWFAINNYKGRVVDKDDPLQQLRLCSHSGCGRPETRRHEFRRCSVCGAVNYCSRACQALDWKLRHKLHCRPPAAAVAVDRILWADDHHVIIPNAANIHHDNNDDDYEAAMDLEIS